MCKSNLGIVSAWFSSGAGYVSKQYAGVLSKRYNVFIYARGGRKAKGDNAWDLPNVVWAPEHYAITGIWKRHFQRWILKNKISILIFNEQRYWPVIKWANELGVKCGAYIDYYTQETVRKFAAYDFLICNTQRHYSVFKWHPQCYYIPWGVRRSSFCSKKGLTERPLTFLISAGYNTSLINDRRGAWAAVQAFLNVRGLCKFRVYSQCPVAAMASEWRRVIEADKRIEIVEGTYDPFPYNEGDVYVYPSRLDGIGLTVPEALAAGLPVIATRNAPMTEFVKDGYNGSTVEVESFLGRGDGYYWAESICSVSDLTQKMQQYVDNISLVRKQSANAIEDAQKHLNWEENATVLPSIVDNAKKMEIDLSLCKSNGWMKHMFLAVIKGIWVWAKTRNAVWFS